MLIYSLVHLYFGLVYWLVYFKVKLFCWTKVSKIYLYLPQSLFFCNNPNSCNVMTCNSRSKHTTLFGCCSPYWPAAADLGLFLFSWAVFRCLRVCWWERADRLDVRSAGCLSASSPVAKSGLPKPSCSSLQVCMERQSTPLSHSACLLSLAQRHNCEPNGSLCLKGKVQLANCSTALARQRTCVNAHCSISSP